MGIRELLGGLDSRTNGNRMFYEKLYLHLQILVTKHKYIYIFLKIKLFYTILCKLGLLKFWIRERKKIFRN